MARVSRKRKLTVASLYMGTGLLLIACLDVQETNPIDESDNGCESCHLQPPATNAHAAHFLGKTLNKDIDCAECHPKPTSWYEEGHPDTVVQVTFPDGSLARSDDSNPKWNGNRCTGVYCHGVALPGGEDNEPIWSSTENRHCNSCHGAPDTPLHPNSDACPACHGAAYRDEDDEVPDPEKHINGEVDLN